MSLYGGAAGGFSLAAGQNTRSGGWCSTATGRETLAAANYSFVTGYGTQVSASHGAAFGTYNVGYSNSCFEVGIGINSSTNGRKNVFEIFQNGLIRAPELSVSEITDPKTLVTKEYAVGTVPQDLGAQKVPNMVTITQANFDNIANPSTGTLYVIKG